MPARIAALLVAVALIAGAFAYRDRDNDSRAGTGEGGRVRLVCATELAAACEEATTGMDVELVVEPAGATYDRIVGAPSSTAAAVDLWVAPAPYPAMVAEARERQAKPSLTGRPARVGGAKLAVVVWKDRAAVMDKSCGGTTTWKCIGEIAGRTSWTASGGRPEWGLVKAGLPDPATEAAGIAALGAATAGFFDRPDLSSVDLAENDTYRGWLAGLARAVPPSTPAVDQMLSTGPALIDFLAAFEPTVTPVVRAASRGGAVAVIYPAPVATTDVQLVTVGRDRTPEDVRDRLAGQLRTQGWTGNARGLPGPGLLDALRSIWKETRR